MPEVSSHQSGAISRNLPPQYRRMKRGKGRLDSAVTYIDGKRVLLGAYGSPESKAKFSELVGASTLGVGPDTPTVDRDDPVSVNQLIVAYLEHTEVYYRTPDGQPGREHGLICEVSRIVRREAGNDCAENFGPLRLVAIREKMVASGWTRKYINKQVDRVRRMFRWAASREMISPSVPQSLSMLDGLHQGRSDAKESTPVLP